MARPRGNPEIRKHSTGQVRVRFGKIDRYFGLWEKPEAHRAAELAISEWWATGKIDPPSGPLLNALLEQFARWSSEWYQKEGQPTSEKWAFDTVILVLDELYGESPLRDFGPHQLLTVRAAFHKKGWGRKHINDQVNRVRRIFRKGVEWNYVPETVFRALQAVQAIPPGKGLAPEPEEKELVAWSVIEATLKHLTPTLIAMVQVQALCAMRPREVCDMLLGDLDREKYLPLWLYQPGRHKTQHRGRLKKIWIGQKAQIVLAPFIAFCDNPSRHIFQSRLGRGYRRDSYNRRIAMACAKGKIEHWSVGQLRSFRLTEIESHYDLDHAAATAGHSEVDITRRHYAKADSLAKKVASESG